MSQYKPEDHGLAALIVFLEALRDLQPPQVEPEPEETVEPDPEVWDLSFLDKGEA